MSRLTVHLAELVELVERHVDAGKPMGLDMCAILATSLRDAYGLACCADRTVEELVREREPEVPPPYARALRKQNERPRTPDWFRDQQDPNVVVIDRGIRTARPFE